MSGYPHTLRPELHKALEAEGIDYWLADGITFWNRDDGCECLAYGYQADGVPKLAIKVVGFTDPEQAIAATLGRGMLTADDVRDLIERHSDASGGNGRDFHNGAYVAIADELNAMLGQGTCQVDVLNTGDCAGYECSEYIMHCNGCGHEFGHVLYNEDGDVWMSEPPNYCPNCGKKIVDPTTNDVDGEVDA